MTSWQNNRAARDARIAAGAGLARGKIVEAHDVTRLLEAVVRSGDRVCLEGDNQKQADLLSRALLAVDLSKVNDLHMVQSGVVLPEHLDLFDRGVAKPNVVPGLERDEQAIQQLGRRRQRTRHFDGLFSHTPIGVTQCAQQVASGRGTLERKLLGVRIAQCFAQEVECAAASLGIIGGEACFELTRPAHLTVLIEARRLLSGMWRVSVSN